MLEKNICLGNCRPYMEVLTCLLSISLLLHQWPFLLFGFRSIFLEICPLKTKQKVRNGQRHCLINKIICRQNPAEDRSVEKNFLRYQSFLISGLSIFGSHSAKRIIETKSCARKIRSAKLIS